MQITINTVGIRIRNISKTVQILSKNIRKRDEKKKNPKKYISFWSLIYPYKKYGTFIGYPPTVHRIQIFLICRNKQTRR